MREATRMIKLSDIDFVPRWHTELGKEDSRSQINERPSGPNQTSKVEENLGPGHVGIHVLQTRDLSWLRVSFPKLVHYDVTPLIPPTMMNAEESNDTPGLAQVQAQYHKLWRLYQHQLDRITPFVYQRWGATAGVMCLFVLRIVFSQGVSASFSHKLTLLTSPYSGTSVCPRNDFCFSLVSCHRLLFL
jgi:hypothetical protein